MKKLFVAASLLAASFGVFAQDTKAPSENSGDYKPVAGDVTAELGLAGGLGTTSTNLGTSGFGVPQLKFRYFLADQLALRVGLNITQNKETKNIYEVAPGSGTGSSKLRTSTTMFNLGVEKHFAGTSRLSTYGGVDLTILFNGVKEKWDNTGNGTTFTNGATAEFTNRNATGNLTANSGFGLRLVAGANYYFVEKVYLGAEFGWGFLATKQRKTKSEVTPGAGFPTTTTEVKSPGKDLTLAPNTVASVVIGFRF